MRQRKGLWSVKIRCQVIAAKGSNIEEIRMGVETHGRFLNREKFAEEKEKFKGGTSNMMYRAIRRLSKLH